MDKLSEFRQYCQLLIAAFTSVNRLFAIENYSSFKYTKRSSGSSFSRLLSNLSIFRLTKLSMSKGKTEILLSERSKVCRVSAFMRCENYEISFKLRWVRLIAKQQSPMCWREERGEIRFFFALLDRKLFLGEISTSVYRGTLFML